MRLPVLLLFAAATVFAQGPAATIQILTPSIHVVAGEQLTLRAVVRDANGVVRGNDIPTFAVDNVNLATVDQFNGLFTSKTLGVSRITARIGNITTSTVIQILPKRIVISPSSATMVIGERKQFTAQAMDKDDRPLPNVAFRWFTSSGTGNTTNTSSITNTGMLSTVASGNILVRASYDYNSNIVPGFERQAQAVATVSIQVPQTYKMSKLLSTENMQGPFQLRARILPMLGNERGQVVFNASLDGTSNGPLMLEGGNSKLLLAAGTPGPLPQTSIIEFSQLALNNRGDVLALSTVLFSGTTIFKIGPDGPDAVYVDPMPLPGTEFLTGPFLNRNCLNDSGTWLFRANYRVANAGPTFTALFTVPERGFPNEVVSTRTALPNFPATFTLDNDFGIGGDGMAYFTATSGAQRALFVNTFDGIRRVIGTGDALLGSTVSRFVGNGFFLNNEGELGVVVVLANNQIQLLRYQTSSLATAPKNLLLRSFGNLYTMSPTQGTLFLGDGGRGYGVYLWKNDPVAVFLQASNASLLHGKTVPALDWATVSAQGEVTIMARTQDNPMEIFYLKPGGEPVNIIQAGDSVDVRAPISISNLMGGDRTGPPHIYLGGRNSSVFEVSSNGLKPVMLMGERFNPTALFPGTGTGDRKASNGDVLISQTAGMGIMRVNNGVQEILQRPGFTLADGAVANSPANVQGNARGDLLWTASTNRGDSRLFLRRGDQITIVTTNSVAATARTEVDGKAVTAWSDQTLDETGRVMLNLRFADNSLALHLWDNGTFTRVAAINETVYQGSVISNLFTIRAGGDTFYAIFTLPGLGNVLAKYRSSKWESAIDLSEVLVTGQTANSVGNYEVNRNGDIFAQCNTNTSVLVVKKGNKYHFIHMLTELTGDNDLLLRYSDLDIRDDGTVYFLGMTVLDDYVLYQAKPI